MNSRKNILVVFGTRPEAIKMAPVILELRKRSSEFDTVVCATAQHREMQDQALRVFDIKPNYDLNLMKQGQSLNDIISCVLKGIGEVLKQEKPDYVLVQGDTSTALATGLAAFHLQIPIGHIEAGLRTYQKYEPFPEEINRKMISVVTDMHFAPTKHAKDNLIKEGNTVIDALFWVLNHSIPELPNLPPEGKIILVTGHRRESFGKRFYDICTGLKSIAERYPDYHLIYPVHLNPNVQKPVYSILGNINNVHLMEPIEYLEFVHLMKRSKLIITDSGGIQEEATALAKPVLVMRDFTERPEAVEAGVCKIIGTNPERLLTEVGMLIEDRKRCHITDEVKYLFGDGRAAKRIVNTIVQKG